MKILVAHNRYQQYGGEDTVFDSEVELLGSAGHEVKTLVVSNDTIVSPLDKLATMLRTVENPVGTATISAKIKDCRPDVVHVHNFFPLLSPAIYAVCHAARIPVVQTLHNFRSLCANGLLLRNHQACHLCLDSSLLWGVIHRCYRGSLAGSLAVTRMISAHRKRGTWRSVDQFIALSKFSRDIFVGAGFPQNRITVKPNFIPDPGKSSDEDARSGVLFVGRLAEGKGLHYLLEAASTHNFPLRIAGDGPAAADLKRRAPPGATFLGKLSRENVIKELQRAAVLVVPSLGYENCPVVVIEAFACATPVIGFRHGAMAEMIDDGVTGFLVPLADGTQLSASIRSVLADSQLARRLGHAARRAFLERFTPETNLRQLEQIYERAIANFH